MYEALIVENYIWVGISNKCFIHCPAEDKAAPIIYWPELQEERKLEITRAG